MSSLADEYIELYNEYARTIRTWFVAYGVGAPVVFLTNDALAKKITESGCAKAIGLCFLVGAVLQVLLASANKFSMWCLYYGETSAEFKKKRRYKLAYRFSEAMWIDAIVEVATLVAFGLGTWWAFKVLAP